MKETQKAWVRMMSVWAGAKYSSFVRYWLGRRRTSSMLTLINRLSVAFYRFKFENTLDKNAVVGEPVKPGSFDVPDIRDFKVSKPKLPKTFDLPLKTNNWKRSGREATNQEDTQRCSAFGGETAKGVLDSCEAEKTIYHDPIQLWVHQIQTGASEKYGDYIQNMLKNMLKHGFVTNGKEYRITEFRRIKDKSVRTLMLWLALGKTIVTGIYVRKDTAYGTNYGRASFDKKGTLHIDKGQKIGGHLQPIVDYETRDDGVWFFFPNSYGPKWGHADGGLWVHESEIHHTMSKYIVFDARDNF